MTANLKNLTAAISEIVEEFIMMAIEIPEPPPAVDVETIGWLDFSGPRQGRITVRCGNALASALAANLLGVSPDDAEAGAKAGDALGEVLNVLCGNLVTRVFGSQQTVHLSVPTVLPACTAHAHRDQPGGHPEAVLEEACVLTFDDQPVEFRLYLWPENL